MRRFLTPSPAPLIAVLSTLTAAESARAQYVTYEWSLSESSTFPYYSTGSPFLGEREIYLWLYCIGLPFDLWVEADLDLVGSLEVVSFTPTTGFTNSGTLPNVHLTAPSCQYSFTLAGSVVVSDSTGTGGSLCFAGANTTRDCGALGGVMHPHGYIGYSTDGSNPCASSETCAIDVALPETWGRVKAQFRR